MKPPFRRRALLVSSLLLLAGAAFIIPTVWLKPYSASHLYSRIFFRFALDSPMLLSQLQFLPPYLDFHSHRLDDRSPAFQERTARRLDRELRILRSYDRSTIPDTLSHDILEWFMADASEADRFRHHGYPLNQMDGEQSRLPDFMLGTHPIQSLRQGRGYVRRLEAFEGYFEAVLEDLELRAERGITPPRFVVRRVLDEMRDFISPPPDEHILHTHLRTRLDSLPDIRPRQRTRLLERAERAITERVYPTYGRLIDHAEQLEAIAGDDDGVWRLPDGQAYYEHLLRHHTTTELSAAEIHALGIREVERIEGELRSILREEGYAAAALGPALAALHAEPRFQWPDTDEGRAAILAEYQHIIDEIDGEIAHLFPARPRASVEVRPVPAFRQETAALASYAPPGFDGSRPGIFYANLRDVGEHARLRMRTLAYHEAVPGHHFQIGLAQELPDLPFFRRVIPFTAYWEGWALYAEQLAAEQGFQDDPYDRIGFLVDQLWRAARLVVDTGIHAERWTREEAIEYMLARTGKPEGDIVAEVERYIVMPGQATSYMVGALSILELREMARERLGEAFQLREFHGVVLQNGAMPLTLLERVVEDWIGRRG